MLYKIYKFFELPEIVWYSFFLFMFLGFSTIIGSIILFWEKDPKMYTIAEIIDEYCGEDIMNPPETVREDYKKALRSACKNDKIETKKIKGKWYILKKSQAFKYLVKWELRGEL